MKQPKKTNLDKAVTAIITRLEKTEKFVLDQAPDICREMLIEETVEVKIDMSLSIALLIVALAAFITGPVLALTHEGEGWKVAGVAGGLLGIILLIPAIIGLMGSIQRLILVKKTPKLFLLREFKRLLK